MLHKLLKMQNIQIVVFVGRRQCNKKIPSNILYSDKGLQYFILNPNCCDVVFDCTDATSSIINSIIFIQQKIKIINLTPSIIGDMFIPNITPVINDNLNMVTCGGQVAIPLLCFLYKNSIQPIYAEVITQISSQSAGLATRINIDNYIEKTEKAIYSCIDILKCKVILNINPNPNIVMKTTIYLKTKYCNFNEIYTFVEKIRKYINNYEITEPIWISENILMVHIKIISSGDYISYYHGNLDVINCVAIESLKYINNNINTLITI